MTSNEASLQLAIQAFKGDETESVKRAAVVYNVARTTLRAGRSLMKHVIPFLLLELATSYSAATE